MKARMAAVVTAVLVSPLALIACQDDAGDNASRVRSGQNAEWEITLVSNDATAKSEIGQLEAEIKRIAKKYDGEASLALALPGSDKASHVITVGEISDEAAWSTSKVPVAIAALRKSPWIGDYIEPMIEESDNDAAETAWLSFGNENSAVESVNDVLAEGHDMHTRFESWVPPGDVEWHLDDQAVFGANLPCVQGSKAVLEYMSHIVDYQSYGLSAIEGSRFKGGWGPDEEGGYLSRQFGVVPTTGGELGVAIAARPGDATDDTARDMLTDMAKTLAKHMPKGGSCRLAK